jgi:hypothetical protein
MDSMTHPERVRLRAAAFRASRVFPGPIGELIHRELMTWYEFGYRLGGHSMIMRLVMAVEAAAEPVPNAA